jgi:hypothetical protein
MSPPTGVATILGACTTVICSLTMYLRVVRDNDPQGGHSVLYLPVYLQPAYFITEFHGILQTALN